MGLWWKKVNAQLPCCGAVSIEGDSEAVSKRWPIVWRFGQNWISLIVQEPYDFWGGYHVYFSSPSGTMKYRKLLFTKFVMVRIGPDRLNFWVEDTQGNVGRLALTEAALSGLFRRRSTQSQVQTLERQRMFGSHTFI